LTEYGARPVRPESKDVYEDYMERIASLRHKQQIHWWQLDLLSLEDRT
jgi:hypothetical protein